MILSHIAAHGKNKVIGSRGDLPWHLPEDLKYFKEKTLGHIIVMGRKTFESFPGPLKNRLHIVVTKQKDYKVPEGVKVFHDIHSALEFSKTQTGYWDDEVFIIGGGEIYRQTLNKADRLYLTLIHREFEGETRYPDYERDFIMIWKKDHFGEIPCSFCLFVPGRKDCFPEKS